MFLSLCSLADEVKPKDNDASQTNENVDLFCTTQMSNETEGHLPTEDMPDSLASQNSMDCEPPCEQDESVLVDNRSDPAVTPSSNGQKPTRPDSPGSPHPVKATCLGACSANPKLTLCLSVSSRKVEGTPSDIKVLSPDSPVCKMAFSNNSTDMHDAESLRAEEPDFAKAQVVESQQVVKDSDSGSLAKEGVHPMVVNTEGEDVAMLGCSSSSKMSTSQDLKENQTDASFKRYFELF